MTNISATMMRERDEDSERANHMLNARIEYFLKRFSPKDRHDSYDFEVRLHEIVRAIYIEAARPYEKIISSGFLLGTAQPFIPKKGPETL